MFNAQDNENNHTRNVALSLGPRVRPSPYFESTLRWGAKSFTTYNHMFMPTVYESPEADYRYLTSTVTLWDVGGERQVQITGKNAFAFTQYLTPRNLASCDVGKCRYVMITDQFGGVLNDPILLRLAENKIWLSLADSDLLWWCVALAKDKKFEVDITIPDVSPLQLQGPHAAEVAVALFGDWARELPYFHLRETAINDIPVVVSRTGWSGELGYEIYLQDGERGNELWEIIMKAGEAYEIRPASPSTIRRLEAGLLSYGADADANDTPFHLNLDRLVDLDGGFDFIGKDALRELKEKGITRRLVGVILDGAPLSLPQVRWWNATDANGNRIGKLRSSVYSLALQKNIGLAMIDKPHDEIGASFTVDTEYGEQRSATVTALPFVKNKMR